MGDGAASDTIEIDPALPFSFVACSGAHIKVEQVFVVKAFVTETGFVLINAFVLWALLDRNKRQLEILEVLAAGTAHSGCQDTARSHADFAIAVLVHPFEVEPVSEGGFGTAADSIRVADTLDEGGHGCSLRNAQS